MSLATRHSLPLSVVSSTWSSHAQQRARSYHHCTICSPNSHATFSSSPAISSISPSSSFVTISTFRQPSTLSNSSPISSTYISAFIRSFSTSSSSSSSSSSASSKESSQFPFSGPITPKAAKLVSLRCWACMADGLTPKSKFFCGSCGMIQPPPKQTNYFDVFAMPAVYDLDTAILDKAYKDLQRQLHPDKFSLKSEQEQTFSSGHASFLSQAYKTLKKPLTRAQYLLHMIGHSTGEEGETVTDPEFLMEIMERREEIESASSKSALEALRDSTESSCRDLERELSSAFKLSSSLSTPSHIVDIRLCGVHDLEKAKNLTLRLLYMDKLVESILNKL